MFDSGTFSGLALPQGMETADTKENEDYDTCPRRNELMLESIQGTCRLSLKMGRGGVQKPVMRCIRR